MIELKNKEQLEGAIERARRDAKNLVVRLTSVNREYRVINRGKGKSYLVTFKVREDGKRFGRCTCVAGRLERICKHLAAAAALNSYLAEQKLLGRQGLMTK